MSKNFIYNIFGKLIVFTIIFVGFTATAFY